MANRKLREDDRDQHGVRLGPRRTVGPADPETRRQAILRALEEERGPEPVYRPKPAVIKPPADNDGQGGIGNRARRRALDARIERMSR